MTRWQSLLVSAAIQFVITAGAALTVAASDNAITSIESLLSLVGGLIASAKDIQAHLAELSQ